MAGIAGDDAGSPKPSVRKPASEAGATTVPEAPPQVPELFAGARVLVVDDVDANVAVLVPLLRSAGIGTVHGLTDPARVARRCVEWQPDLVVLGLHMPDMEGMAVLKSLEATLPEDSFVPVLVLASDGTSMMKEQALAAGAKDFLAKPINRAEVLLRIKSLLATRALYLRVQRRTTELQQELDRMLEQERSQSEQFRRQFAEIRDVLTGDQLQMVFQPVVDLDSGDVVGVEALARFRCSPPRPPNEWFAEAEHVGLGVELELFAVQRALANIELLEPGNFMSVNVSPATAMTEELRARLAVAPGHRVVLELTEHVRVHDYDALWPAFDELRAQGVRIAVDDAGAGYASLQHILRLRPDIVKLDNELTHAIHADPPRRALAAALTSFAGEIGAALVAEGIETPEDLETLQSIGVPWGQGYHLAPPGTLPLAHHRHTVRS